MFGNSCMPNDIPNANYLAPWPNAECFAPRLKSLTEKVNEYGNEICILNLINEYPATKYNLLQVTLEFEFDDKNYVDKAGKAKAERVLQILEDPKREKRKLFENSLINNDGEKFNNDEYLLWYFNVDGKIKGCSKIKRREENFMRKKFIKNDKGENERDKYSVINAAKLSLRDIIIKDDKTKICIDVWLSLKIPLSAFCYKNPSSVHHRLRLLETLGENICNILDISKDFKPLIRQLNLLDDMLKIAGAFPFLFCDEGFSVTNVLNTSVNSKFWFSLLKESNITIHEIIKTPLIKSLTNYQYLYNCCKLLNLADSGYYSCVEMFYDLENVLQQKYEELKQELQLKKLLQGDKYYAVLFTVKTLKPVFKFIERIKLLVNALTKAENSQMSGEENQYDTDDILNIVDLEYKLIESGFCDQATFSILPGAEYENMCFVRAVVKAYNEDTARIMPFVYYDLICDAFINSVGTKVLSIEDPLINNALDINEAYNDELIGESLNAPHGGPFKNYAEIFSSLQ